MKKNRSYLAFLLLGILLIVLRSIPIVFFDHVSFNSDESIYGLMTKHFIEQHQFMFYMYGGKYLLAISSYLAIPFVYFMGATPAAMKLPMLMCNILLFWLVFREARKSSDATPAYLFLATSILILPSTGAIGGLLNPAPAMIEPLLAILALWVFRARPLASGVISAIGFLNRPFAVYGFLGVIFCEMLGDPRQIQWRRKVITASVATALIIALKYVAQFSTNYFGMPSPISLFKRPRFILEDLRAIVLQVFPHTMGLGAVYGWTKYAVAPLVVSLLGFVLFIMIVRKIRQEPAKLIALIRRKENEFPVFMIVVGILAIGVYCFFSPPTGDSSNIRYTTPILLAPVGFYLILHKTSHVSRIRTLAMIFLASLMTLNLYSLVRDTVVFQMEEREDRFGQLMDYLEKNRLTRGYADYWVAYQLDFLSQERLIYTPLGLPRIREYVDQVEAAPKNKIAIIQSASCIGGTLVAGWHVCSP